MTLKYIDFSVDMYGTTAISASTYPVVYTGDESSANVRFTVTDEPNLTGATAKVHLYFSDSHHIERDLVLEGLVFSYTLVGTENDHTGVVRADIMITLGGSTFTRAGYKFRVDASLEASAPLVEYVVDTLDTLVDGAEDWLLQAQSDFGTAQAQRADEWTTDNTTRDDAFDTAQSSREAAFSDSESARASTFNTNETSRSNTFTTNENARQAVAEANQAQAATDHSTAVVDHDTAVADSTLASSDHVTAVADHSTAVTDHSTASADHAAAIADQEIVDGLQDQFDDVIANATVDSEVINARQGSATLGQNILSMKEQLEQTNVLSAEAVTKADAMASGSPKGVYTTLALLQAAYPTGTTGAYLVTADGNWYYWSGSVWTVGGTYQSTGIADKSVARRNLADDVLKVYDSYVPDYSSSVGYYDKAISNLWKSNNSNNDITLYGIAASTPLVFDGTNGYGTLNKALTNISFNVKVKPTAFTLTHRVLSTTLGGSGLELAISSVGNIKISPSGYDTGITLTLNQTYVIGVTLNISTGQLKLFVNGELKTTITVSVANLGTQIIIGGSGSGAGNKFTGEMYKASFTDGVLTDAQMIAEQNAMSSSYNIMSIDNSGTIKRFDTSKLLHNNLVLSDFLNKLKGYNPKFAHISFDDVRYCMEDITTNAATYTSIFDNPFFSMLKTLHETYGTVVSLYLFTTQIATFTDKFKSEFAENSDWLKFGLHLNGYAGNYATTTASNALADYNGFTAGIIRITGTPECIDKCPRLSNFAGNLESCLAMRDANAGIVGLLSAYDTRQSYYLSVNDSNYVYKHGRLYDAVNYLTFFRSLTAMEASNPNITLPALLTLSGSNSSEYLVMMMHEYAVYDSTYTIISNMVTRLEYASNFANTNGYAWDYPMNRIIG